MKLNLTWHGTESLTAPRSFIAVSIGSRCFPDVRGFVE